MASPRRHSGERRQLRSGAVWVCPRPPTSNERHPGGSRDPVSADLRPNAPAAQHLAGPAHWIPAFAGMTVEFALSTSNDPTSF